MIYRNLFNKENYEALRDLQVSFGWSNQQLDYLIACMKFESNLNPCARNKISGAVGLIQFLPSTLKAFNLTPEAVLTMNFSAQIKLVKRYFQPYYKRTKTLNDMYMASFMPYYIGKPDNAILSSEGERAYNQNKALDKNKDGKITKEEACIYVNHIYKKGLFSAG